MVRGTAINKKAAVALILCAAMTAVWFILACAPPNQVRQYAKSPGIYGLTGWNNMWTPYTLDGVTQAGSTDINGEVGHPLQVNGPTTNCVTRAGERQPWSCNFDTVSGSLPPGVSLDYSSGTISGIPTERGHWIVTMKVYNIVCGDNTWAAGFPQQLRFHITGTGKVIE